jgi:RecA-family ATPase
MQVRQFIRLLKKLARKHSCAILLLAHPSLTGMNTGSGLSGSTDWNNGVRSRLYLQTPKTSEGDELSRTVRTFQGMKANYSEVGGKFDVEWKDGVFVRVNGLAGFEKMAREQKVDETFLALLKRLTAQNRPVRATMSRAGAPVLFAAEPDSGGFTRKDFDASMSRLLAKHKILNESEGPPSKRSCRLVINEDYLEPGCSQMQ